MATQRTQFAALCDLIDELCKDTADSPRGAHYVLANGYIVCPSHKATNGKFTLCLYNSKFTNLLNQARVSTIEQLIVLLSDWIHY